MHIGAVMFFTEYSMQPVALGRELEQRGFEIFVGAGTFARAAEPQDAVPGGRRDATPVL